MPTARELLEQADALMRRNRGREPEPDIPELTDEVAVAEPTRAERHESGRRDAPMPSPPAEDVPELTDAIGRVEEVSIEALPDESEESRWLESMLGGSSVTGPAPDSIAVVPPSTLRAAEPAAEPGAGRSDEHKLSPDTAAALASTQTTSSDAGVATSADSAFDAMLGMRPAEGVDRAFAPPELPPELTEPPAADATSVAPIAAAPIAEAQPPESAIAEIPDAEPPLAAAATEEASPAPAPLPSWDAVAEEIRMQVLQRIDIFTDTGLQGELAARLQPVVDRASADLIATINREVGQLLRTYVAEAIEREIQKWRESNP